MKVIKDDIEINRNNEIIKSNIKTIKNNIVEICKTIKRNPDDIVLIAVSKTKPIEDIYEVYNNGIRDFGENRVQEIIEKYDKLPNDIKWHMIGHLQSNKVKYIIDKVTMIHSVDSIKLANQINSEAIKHNLTMDILLEVNVSGETSKFGFKVDEVYNAMTEIGEMTNVNIKGLMTVAPFTEVPEDVRCYFRELRELLVDITKKSTDNSYMLSMGMSVDYAIAIEEGTSHIRIGTGIFGHR